MKLHRHREHHDVKKLNRLIAQGALPVGVGGHCQLIEANTIIRQTGTLLRSFLPLRQPAPYP